MILSRFQVYGFRGKYNVDISFKEKVNYLIGRNGTGKTTLMKILYASISMRIGELQKAPFERVEIDFITSGFGGKQGFRVVYSRTDKREQSLPGNAIFVSLERPGQDDLLTDSTTMIRRRGMRAQRSFSDENTFLSYLSKNRGAEFITTTQMDEVRKSFEAADVIRDYVSRTLYSRWLPVERYSRGNVQEDGEMKSPVDLKVDELQNQLVRYLSEVEKASAIEFEKFRNGALLSLFEVEPNLQDKKKTAKQDIDHLENELKLLIPELKLDQATERKFREKSESLLKALRERQSGRPLEALRQAAARLNDIVRLWRDTQLRVQKLFERRDGFLLAMEQAFSLSDLTEKDRRKFSKKPLFETNNELFFQQETAKESLKLGLTDLSSGEKQFFILLAEVLLERDQETILLIDEPELSLHITWQAALVGDLKSLNPNAQIVLATHSPDIVQPGDRAVIQMEDAVHYP